MVYLGLKKACPYCQHTEFTIWRRREPWRHADPWDFVCIHCGKVVRERSLVDAKDGSKQG